MLTDPTARFIRRHLKRAPAEDWMYSVCSLAYDGDGEAIGWILSQPACDKGVALALYWRLAPRWHAQYSCREEAAPHELNTFDLLRELERRYLSGFYKASTIAFDPRNDPAPIGDPSMPGYDWTQDYADQPCLLPIPEEMLRPVAGREVDFEGRYRTWVDGMPSDVSDAFMHAMDHWPRWFIWRAVMRHQRGTLPDQPD